MTLSFTWLWYVQRVTSFIDFSSYIFCFTLGENDSDTASAFSGEVWGKPIPPQPRCFCCNPGPAGPKGPRGERGHRGPRGLAGASGEAGAMGEAGATEGTGATGPTGLPGLAENITYGQPFVVWVDGSTTSTSQDGTISNPYATIQAAIDNIELQPTDPRTHVCEDGP